MIQFIAGRSGSGKTEEIYRRIQAEQQPEKVILLVPDQSSFQNERKILNRLGAKDAAKIRVFGLKRLYEHLEEQYRFSSGKRIDDGAKAVLMSLAAASVSDRLKLYGGRAKKADFAALMLETVNEYKSCAISPEQLTETAAKIEDDHFRQKLTESAAVYAAYDALLYQAYADPEDDMERLYQILCRHPFFFGTRVYIDSFNSFSEREYKVIREILRQAEYIGIAVGCDGLAVKEGRESIFREPYIVMKKLTAFAHDNSIEVLPTVHLTEQHRFLSPSLKAVEESLFRFDGDAYDEEDGAVKLYETDSEYDEVQQAAREICLLVRQEDYAYRDITVICREPDRYRHIMEAEFPKYDIPFFLSDKKPLEANSLIRLILSAFEIVHTSFATEAVFTYLKTELANLTPSEIFRLENYVYLWDIRGKRWTKPFTMNPDGNVTTAVNAEVLSEIESLRQKAVKPLTDFAAKLKQAENGADISRAVYELLEQAEVRQSVRTLAAYFREQKNIRAKETEARIWDITMEILDKMYRILEHTRVDSRRYAELLQLMIRNTPLLDIPQTLDQVTVGKAGSIIAEQPRAVLILGAMEGIFPAAITASGLFSDSERSELIRMDLPLNHAVYDRTLLEKYNVYIALTSASERLFVSCHTDSAKGETMKPSVIFEEIQAILPKVPIRRKAMLTDEELYFTQKQSFEVCALSWNRNTPQSNALKAYFTDSPQFAAECRAVRQAVEDAPYVIRDKQTAKSLFHEKKHLSPSQAEAYYQCPFAYFCKYGLNLYPRKRAVMDAGMYGSVVHYILESVLREESWEQLRQYDVPKLSELAGKYVRQYISDLGGTEERLERFMAQFAIIERNVVLVLKRLIDEFAVSRFVPQDMELKIGGKDGDIPGYELHLPDGEVIAFTGKVDRIDTYVQGNEKYIRIVDYKTGARTFRLSDVCYGLNMQMLLYLSAISRNGVERYSENGHYTLLPAGILYMPSTPKSSVKSFCSDNEKQKSLEEQQKNFKMSGLLLNDDSVLSAMEEGKKGIYIPVKSLVSLEEYGKIFSYIDKKLVNMMQALFDGKVERKPIKAAADACEYCDYRTVCGYEDGRDSQKIRTFPAEEALQKMEEEMQHG